MIQIGDILSRALKLSLAHLEVRMKKTTMAVSVLVAVCAGTTLLANLDNQKAFVAKYPDAKASLGKC
jgi:hypothetical protein